MSSVSSMSSNTAGETTQPTASESVGEVFRVFLKLGLTSFGGPIAHLGYFREELVVQRKWIDEPSYVDLVTLCQFLPGPASSQVGFSLGILRGKGLLGGLAAWLGSHRAFGADPACLRSQRGGVCWPGRRRTPAWAQARGCCRGGASCLGHDANAHAGSREGDDRAGRHRCRRDRRWIIRADRGDCARRGRRSSPLPWRTRPTVGTVFAALFLVPLVISGSAGQAVALFEAFYRSGALVFGGGHVVLPLLQAQVVAPHWVTNETFLAGYGLAQAVPGPLFTFAAYLGAVIEPPPNGVAGSAIALVAIFLPGMLLVYGMLPFWDELRARQFVQAAMRGANAAVVGILGLTLYNPIWTSAVLSPRDFALAVGGFLLLTAWKAPPWVVVMLLAAAGTLLAATHYS
jgi:chromate transporter